MRIPPVTFSWASGSEVWSSMLEKDNTYFRLRSENMLENHPSLVDSFRTILFDWLSEVSHECKFHRETYHLALDFIDRFLSKTTNIGKYQLQLIGTTCLFLAAKFEEIRPPTVSEFAELTDGACKPEEIIDNEVTILSSISWDITPMTPNSWLNIYMQLAMNHAEACETGQKSCPLLPTNNGIMRYKHKRIASLIDLALLHIQSLRFPNSILTASALYHYTNEQTVRQSTGYRYQELSECVQWLQPFVEVINEIEDQVFVISCRDEEYSNQMHSHIASAALLDKVIERMETKRQSLKRKVDSLEEEVLCSEAESEVDSLLSASPLKPYTTVLLTPPSSTRKSRRLR